MTTPPENNKHPGEENYPGEVSETQPRRMRMDDLPTPDRAQWEDDGGFVETHPDTDQFTSHESSEPDTAVMGDSDHHSNPYMNKSQWEGQDQGHEGISHIESNTSPDRDTPVVDIMGSFSYAVRTAWKHPVEWIVFPAGVIIILTCLSFLAQQAMVVFGVVAYAFTGDYIPQATGMGAHYMSHHHGVEAYSYPDNEIWKMVGSWLFSPIQALVSAVLGIVLTWGAVRTFGREKMTLRDHIEGIPFFPAAGTYVITQIVSFVVTVTALLLFIVPLSALFMIGINPGNALNYIVPIASLVMLTLTVVAALLPFFLFQLFFTMDGLSIMDSLKQGVAVGRKHYFPLLGWVLVFLVGSFLVSLVTFGLGSVLIVPLGILAQVYLYRSITRDMGMVPVQAG